MRDGLDGMDKRDRMSAYAYVHMAGILVWHDISTDSTNADNYLSKSYFHDQCRRQWQVIGDAISVHGD